MGVTVVWFRLSFRLVRHVRQQRYDARAFDGDGKVALVLGAHARHTPGHDFAALGHKLFKGCECPCSRCPWLYQRRTCKPCDGRALGGDAFFGLPCCKPPFSKISFAGCSRKDQKGMSSDWMSVKPAMSCALSPPRTGAAPSSCCLGERNSTSSACTSRDMRVVPSLAS